MNSNFLLSTLTLIRREFVRFYRQRSRAIGVVAPPLIFWFFLGSGFGSSFREGGASQGAGYLQYFFPGTVMMVVLFTAIFSTISIIEDRQQGFLQSVLVAPVSRSGIALGKITGAALLATLQGFCFLILAPLAGYSLSVGGLLSALLTLWLVSFTLAGLGFSLAWIMDSTQGFHAIMNLFLVPMWMLSGALFPVSGAPVWLQLLMKANPMTYGQSALRESLNISGDQLSFTTNILVILFFAGLTYTLAVIFARKIEKGV